jgi:hypothetical protein
MATRPRTWYFVPISVEYAWHLGGRLADLPGDALDGLAQQITNMPSRPSWLRLAQTQVDASRRELLSALESERWQR